MNNQKIPEIKISELLNFFNDELSYFSKKKYSGTTPVEKAIQYALDGSGKRIRPLLCLSSAIAVGSEFRSALIPAFALEMIHTYSLVHDDLPAMDDDSIRRGRPTVHVAFDEATAILAGDGLLTDALGIVSHLQSTKLTKSATSLSPSSALAIVSELSEAAGSQGMVKGQSIDMSWTGRIAGTSEELDNLHLLKTGKLLAASCAVGALTKADPISEEVDCLRDFGNTIGLAFQIRDDVIDCFQQTGKTPNKDLNSGKFTYLSLMGPEKAMVRARELTEKSLRSLPNIGSYALLRSIAESLMVRIG